MRGGDIYAHMCASLCSPNGHPAIQAKYTYSTLLPAFLFGCVVYASATVKSYAVLYSVRIRFRKARKALRMSQRLVNKILFYTAVCLKVLPSSDSPLKVQRLCKCIATGRRYVNCTFSFQKKFFKDYPYDLFTFFTLMNSVKMASKSSFYDSRLS